MTDEEIEVFNKKQIFLERNMLLLKQLNMGRNFVPSLKSADKVLLVGHCDTFHGNAHESGFVSVIRKTLIYKYKNITVDSLGVCHDDHESFLNDLQNGPLSSFQPTVVMMFIGHEVLQRNINQQATSTKSEIKRLVAYFARLTPKIVLSGLFGHHGITSEAENQHCEDWNDALRQIAKEYEVYFLNLLPSFHQLRSQMGSHDQILSYDGYRLNQLGNKIVAKHVLQAFGISSANYTKFLSEELQELRSAGENQRAVQEQLRSLADVQPIEE